MSNRIELESAFHAAEAALAAAGEEAQALEARVDEFVDATAGKAVDAKTRIEATKLEGQLDAAKAKVAVAQEKRDEAMKALSVVSNAPFINGHSAADLGLGGATPKGFYAGFGPGELEEGLRKAIDHPVRIGGIRPVQDGGAGFRAVTDSTAWGTAGVSQYDLNAFPFLRERPSVLELFPGERIDRSSYTYFVISTGATAAAVSAESGDKPTSSPALTPTTVDMEFVAHVGLITKQVILTGGPARDQLVGEFMLGLIRSVDDQLVNGTNVSGSSLNGLLHAMTSYSITRDATNERRLAALSRAKAQVRENAFLEATHVLVNPADLHAMRIEESTSGGFLLGASQEAQEQNSYWGLKVVETTAIASGTALVLNPAAAATLVYVQGAALDINPYEGWGTNEIGVRAEYFGNLAVHTPKAGCIIHNFA